MEEGTPKVEEGMPTVEEETHVENSNPSPTSTYPVTLYGEEEARSATPIGKEEEISVCDNDPESSHTTHSSRRKCCLRHRINNKASIVALRVFLALLIIGISAILVSLLVATLFFRSGTLNGTSGWHGNVMVSILILYAAILLVFLLVVYFRRRFAMSRKEEDADAALDDSEAAMSDDHEVTDGVDDAKPFAIKVKKVLLYFIIPLTIIILVGAEVFFILTMPTASIFPLQMIGVQDAIASSPEGGGQLPVDCDVAGQMEVVKVFFQNNTMINFDRVRVVVGGSPVHFNKNGRIGANVMEETIHLPRHSCPSVPLLVHEMVHVWQVQSGWWFGAKGLRRVVQYVKDSRKCFRCLYDLGGPEGSYLKEMFDRAIHHGDPVAADITLAFGPEQMAEIVELYYFYFYGCELCVEPSYQLEYGAYDNSGNYYAPEYFAALAFYARQIVGGDDFWNVGSSSSISDGNFAGEGDNGGGNFM